MATDMVSKEVGAWEALNANVKSRLQELPQLGQTVQDLDAVIVEAKEFQSVHDVHRRQIRETTQRGREILRRGRSIRNRLVAGVQSAFGVDSMLVVEFGVRPRLPQRRRRLTPEEKVAKLTAELEAAVAAASKKKG